MVPHDMELQRLEAGRGSSSQEELQIDADSETDGFRQNFVQVLQDVERGARFGLGCVATGLRIAELLPTVDEQLTTRDGRGGGTPPEDHAFRSRRSRPATSHKPKFEDMPDMFQSQLSSSMKAPIDRLESADVSPPQLNHYRSATREFAVPHRDDKCSIQQLSFMTYNAGLLQYRVLGMNLFQNPPFTESRLAHLPVALQSTHADFVALQEVFSDAHADLIINGLLTVFPFHARCHSGDFLKLHNGLMILSKFPIVKSKFHPFQHVTRMESVFASKGFLEVTVSVPDVGNLALLNIHLASGAIDPESKSIETLRNQEIDHIMEVATEATSRGECPVILGDLNAAPDLCPTNYNRFIRSGMIDAFLQASVGIPSPNPLLWQAQSLKELSLSDGAFWNTLPTPDTVTSGLQFAENHFHTWDPMNPLNRLGPHAGCAGSRCDHIFIPHRMKGGDSNPLRSFYPARSDIKMQAPRVLVESFFAGVFGSRLFTLSDHYGVYVQLRRSISEPDVSPS